LPVPAKVFSFVLAKTGQIAGAVCGDHALRVWALPEGRLLRTIDLGDRMIDLTVISDDGGAIAAGDHAGGYTVWDTSTGVVKLALSLPFYPSAMVFSADGARLAIAPVGEGALVRRSAKLDDPVSALNVSPNGVLVAATLMHADNMLMPGLVIVSDTTTGRRVTQWLPPTLALGGGWTGDGRLLIATATDTAVHVWRVQ
jgi:WD40 repeat protein